MAIGAGTGLVYILRWYWWRINAWSEISAMVVSFVLSMYLQFVVGISSADPEQFTLLMILTVLGSSAVWITVTFLTAPEKDDVLIKFYNRVKPGGRLWKKVYQKHGLEQSKDLLSVSLRDWILGVILIYCFLFSVGNLLFGNLTTGLILLMVSFVVGYFIWRDLRKM